MSIAKLIPPLEAFSYSVTAASPKEMQFVNGIRIADAFIICTSDTEC